MKITKIKGIYFSLRNNKLTPFYAFEPGDLLFPNTEFQRQLSKAGACLPAREWVGSKTLQEAWEQCDRCDWLGWLFVNQPVPKGKPEYYWWDMWYTRISDYPEGLNAVTIRIRISMPKYPKFPDPLKARAKKLAASKAPKKRSKR